MPSTAPEVNGTPTRVVVTCRYIDANGTKDSFSILTTLARATNAVVEAAKDALGAATNANVYEVNIQSIYASGTASPSAATEAPRESAKDVIETLHKDPSSGKAQYVYVPAPLDEMFVPDTNTPDIENTLYTDMDAAFELLLPAAYNAISVRFAEHRNTAEKVDR
jgi:hypothetical protein